MQYLTYGYYLKTSRPHYQPVDNRIGNDKQTILNQNIENPEC